MGWCGGFIELPPPLCVYMCTFTDTCQETQFHKFSEQRCQTHFSGCYKSVRNAFFFLLLLHESPPSPHKYHYEHCGVAASRNWLLPQLPLEGAHCALLHQRAQTRVHTRAVTGIRTRIRDAAARWAGKPGPGPATQIPSCSHPLLCPVRDGSPPLLAVPMYSCPPQWVLSLPPRTCCCTWMPRLLLIRTTAPSTKTRMQSSDLSVRDPNRVHARSHRQTREVIELPDFPPFKTGQFSLLLRL